MNKYSDTHVTQQFVTAMATPIATGAKDDTMELSHLDDPLMQQVMDEASREQTVSIIVFGKVGSGKTSLVSTIVKEDRAQHGAEPDDGFEASTKTIDMRSFQVGEVTINVTDTCGMMDTGAASEDEKMVRLVKTVVKKDSRAVLIVCIEMFGRIDRSTLETLALLHQKVRAETSNDEKSTINKNNHEFWSRVIIALTKADKYQEEDWLMNDRHGLSKSLFISKTFEKKYENRKESLKKMFTASPTECQSGCYIGMTADEFEKLKISESIIPTSRLTKSALDRMKQVDCGYWFDQLLIKCCQRLQGSGLLELHAGRLLKLPTKLVIKEVGEEGFTALQKKRSRIANFYILALIYIWYQKRQYYKKVNTMDRFVMKPKPVGPNDLETKFGNPEPDECTVNPSIN